MQQCSGKQLQRQRYCALIWRAPFSIVPSAQSIKQGEQAAKLGVGDPKLFAQQRTMAEKNVKVGWRQGCVLWALLVGGWPHGLNLPTTHTVSA